MPEGIMAQGLTVRKVNSKYLESRMLRKLLVRFGERWGETLPLSPREEDSALPFDSITPPVEIGRARSHGPLRGPAPGL